jgi:phosphatidylserine/phosphatidylglycerophosphate/cardiolipin synthase-like enzyme
MMMMDGPAACALGDLARTRWTRADGQTPPPATDTGAGRGPSLWPGGLDADLHDVEVAIARTEPAWGGREEVREVEALHLDSIRQARRSIYLENQYFASPVVAEALAARLAEPDGPDVALISSLNSPSYFDRLTMDWARSALIARLRAADVYGRFRAYCPLTAAGRPIVVHSKVAVIDERIARVGSGNLNNRSGGFDTECDVAVETRSVREEAAVSHFRARLIGHFAGVEPGNAQDLIAERGLAKGMDALAADGGGRLSRLRARAMGPAARLIAAYHLGDPCDPSDSWRPGRRRRRLRARMSRLLAPTSGAARDPEVDR